MRQMAAAPGRPNLARGLEQAKATPGAVVLDVREANEYAGGHVPGSINLPLGRVAAISLPQETPLFVYCLSGARSRQACAILSQLGYKAVNMGGVLSYKGPLVRLENEKK